ncbi:hypothetical protein [Nonomuraea sp. NPDC049784]
MRGIAVSEKVRERIASCEDTATLEAWFQRAFTVESADGLFV